MNRLAYGLARTLVRLAGSGLPEPALSRFLREWDAELWQVGGSPSGGPLKMMHMSLGAFPDARALKRIQRTRGMGGRETMMGFIADLRVAIRGLVRSRGFALTAVLTLGIGLGGTASMSTIVDSILIKPLPYPEADRLVSLQNDVPAVGEGTIWGMSTAQHVFIDEELPQLEAVGLYNGFSGNIETPSGPIRVVGARVTPSTLRILGAQPLHGRLFTEAEGTRDEPMRVLLSEEFWSAAYGSDPAVLGRTLSLNGEALEVVGIVASGFRIPGRTVESSGIYLPLQIDRGARFYNQHTYGGVARLSEGQTLETANTALVGMLARLPERFPRAYGRGFIDQSGFRPHAVFLKDDLVGDTAGNLWVLLGGVVLVLFIAVVNVTNLFIVRMEERAHELSLRAALGADRGTLTRFVAAEVFALMGAGAILGVLVAGWAVPAIVGLAPDTLPRIEEVRLTGAAVLATVGASALAGAILVLGTMLRFGSVRGGSGEPSRTTTSGRKRKQSRRVLVVAQVALALTLLSGAGLLIQSANNLRALDPGFETQGTLSVDVYLEPGTHRTETEIWQSYSRILDGVRALPGVEHAGVTSELPLSGGFGCTVQGFADQEIYDRLRDSEMTTCAGQTYVSPGFFEAAGIDLLAGRTFRNGDNDDPTNRAVVVSRAFARRFFAEDEPIGRMVNPSGRTETPFYQVVGVVDDIPRTTLDGERAMAIYYPLVKYENPGSNWGMWRNHHMRLVVKAGVADPTGLAGAIRRVVNDVDPAAPIGVAEPLAARVDRSMARIDLVMLLLEIAAGMALLLAAVGIYGVFAYMVNRRTREIGMRLALGAQPERIRRDIMAGSAVLAVIGIVTGLLLSASTGPMLESLLYDVGAADPAVLIFAGGLLAGVALLASWIPARRASRIDPVEALRAD